MVKRLYIDRQPGLCHSGKANGRFGELHWALELHDVLIRAQRFLHSGQMPLTT